MKMILTDLDHTLLRQDGSISDNTIDTIDECRSKGIIFAIATARYWIGAERYIDQLKPDYEITTDGTLIHSKDGCIYSSEFSESDTDLIVRSILNVVPEAEITVAHGKTVYWNSKHIAESEKLHKAVYYDYSMPLGVKGNKIVAELPDENIARDIASKIGCKLQCYRGEKWYSFLPKGSGKITAIEEMIRLSGIRKEDIVAFGDDDNDIEMLRMCGKGVAVANAVPEVLRTADDITLSNDEDGVAKWLRRNLL
ncbi:MAG: HAD family phosphatase [Clostridiales bacterium]|nr:HAD family phosphatase [Clostridiales bacterium]